MQTFKKTRRSTTGKQFAFSAKASSLAPKTRPSTVATAEVVTTAAIWPLPG